MFREIITKFENRKQRKMVNLFQDKTEWNIIMFNANGEPVIINDTNFCVPSNLTPNSNLNTLSIQEKWDYLLCEIYLNNNNSFPLDWSHTLFNTATFELENYREKLEQLLIDTHDWNNEPVAVKNDMQNFFGNDWEQKVAEYMSWTGLEMTDEYNTWVATQSSFIPTTFSNIPNNGMTIEEEFFSQITKYWTDQVNINYVLNNCN